MRSLGHNSGLGYFGALLVCSLTLWSCRSSPKPAEASGTAKVNDSSVTFWFPAADPNRKWIWGTSQDDLLEYAWLAQVGLKGERYEICYSNFKSSGSNRKGGSLEALLFEGQTSIWRLKEHGTGGTVVEGIFASGFVKRGIAAFRQADGVAIQLTDPNFVKAFVSEKPEQVILRTDGTMLGETKWAVNVSYELAEDQ